MSETSVDSETLTSSLGNSRERGGAELMIIELTASTPIMESTMLIVVIAGFQTVESMLCNEVDPRCKTVLLPSTLSLSLVTRDVVLVRFHAKIKSHQAKFLRSQREMYMLSGRGSTPYVPKLGAYVYVTHFQHHFASTSNHPLLTRRHLGLRCQ